MPYVKTDAGWTNSGSATAHAEDHDTNGASSSSSSQPAPSKAVNHSIHLSPEEQKILYKLVLLTPPQVARMERATPKAIQRWLDKQHADSDEEEQMKQQVQEAMVFLWAYLTHSHCSDGIKAVVRNMFAYERFTMNLAFSEAFEPMLERCRSHLHALGNVLQGVYRRHQLGLALASSGKDGFGAQLNKHSMLSAVSEADVNQSSTVPFISKTGGHFHYQIGTQLQDEIMAMHVLSLTALGCEDGFHEQVRGVASASGHPCEVHPASIKGIQRMINKVVSRADYRHRPPPRCGFNLDIVRNMIRCNGVSAMISLAMGLAKSFGGYVKWKNLFELPTSQQKERYHLLSFMISVVYDSKRTYQELHEDPAVQRKWHAYRGKPQGVPKEQWEAQVDATVDLLTSERKHETARIIGEVQVLLDVYVRIRGYMHEIYKVARAQSDYQLQIDYALSNVGGSSEARADTMWRACKRGQLSVLQQFIEQGQNVNQMGSESGRPLIPCIYEAADKGHVHVVDCLIEAKADLNMLRPQNKCPALYIAASHGRLDIVYALLQGRADVNLATAEGATPLHIATYNGHLDVMEELLRARADVAKEFGPHGTALSIATDLAHDSEAAAILCTHRDRA